MDNLECGSKDPAIAVKIFRGSIAPFCLVPHIEMASVSQENSWPLTKNLKKNLKKSRYGSAMDIFVFG